jgi:hypothetical protein
MKEDRITLTFLVKSKLFQILVQIDFDSTQKIEEIALNSRILE